MLLHSCINDFCSYFYMQPDLGKWVAKIINLIYLLLKKFMPSWYVIDFFIALIKNKSKNYKRQIFEIWSLNIFRKIFWAFESSVFKCLHTFWFFILRSSIKFLLRLFKLLSADSLEYFHYSSSFWVGLNPHFRRLKSSLGAVFLTFL